MTTCPHHWDVETPHGPLSRGVCRLCGEAKDFPNGIENALDFEEQEWYRKAMFIARERQLQQQEQAEGVS